MRKPLEIRIEDYLADRVLQTGGETRKVQWIGRKSAPDRLCWWSAKARSVYVEVKRPGEEARPDQLREHERMRSGGMDVRVIDTKEGVDALIEEMTK